MNAMIIIGGPNWELVQHRNPCGGFEYKIEWSPRSTLGRPKTLPDEDSEVFADQKNWLRKVL